MEDKYLSEQILRMSGVNPKKVIGLMAAAVLLVTAVVMAVRVARLVDAEDFILKFEKGYDTDVGEGGNRLSVGQKQLISFARALLADPAIFVLDEATSSVDTETEMKIQSAIEMALKGRTSFIIAHRLSTIRMADRILVIRKGKITEMGTHEELLTQRGYYYDLYTNQFKDEATAAALQ